MSSAEHAKIQLQETVAGEGSLEYTNANDFGRDLVAAGNKFDNVVLEIRRIVDRGMPFFVKEHPPLEFLGGVLKRLRTIADALDECKKAVDTGMRPRSLRSVIELKMVTRMLWTAAQTGEPCVVRTNGKKFIASATTIFTIPNHRKEPERFKEFLDFLTVKGFGHIIRPGEELSYREVEAALTSLLARQDEMLPPYPEYLKAVTVPSVTMKEDTNVGK